MKTTTLLKIGAVAAASYGVSRVLRRLEQSASGTDAKFDSSDIEPSQVQDISDIQDTMDVEVPVVVTDEIVVITDLPPYDVIIPGNDRDPRR